MERRDFIKSCSMGGATLMLPLSVDAHNNERRKSLKFSICADVHKDVMHDADARLQAFITDASSRDLDFIIQLGDFCRPYDYNLDFMSIWNNYSGKKYHVLGNHDTDGGFTQEQVVKYWKAIDRYYSFDCKGYHFVVLDGNEHDPSPDRPDGYARFISEEQLDWLEKDLDQTNLPTIVFCHQGIDNDLGGIYNATQSRLVLERANKKAGFHKVQVVFSGHHHQNYDNLINDIHYVQINSMSYQWLGEKYKKVRYSKAIDESHPWIKYTVPYKDPIWAYVEIRPNGMLQLQGKRTEFVGPTPEELGMPKYAFGHPNVPMISDRKIKF